MRENNNKNPENGKKILKFLEERYKVVKGIEFKLRVLPEVKKLRDRAIKENLSKEEIEISKEIIYS